MKKCPQCGRDYNDDSMSFCLDDGAELLFGPASMDEPATAILHTTAGVGDAPTRTFEPAVTAGETALFPVAQPVSNTASRKNTLVAGVLGIVLVTALGVGSYFLYGRGSSKQIGSIAVMPFVNESGNADVEYLSDGMTETLISSLSNLPNLNVKPRSTVFRYKGRETNPQTIAKELNVQAILNGRVVQRGQDISLFVELIDVALDKVVWSQQYNRKQDDLVTMQSDIARDVSSKLKSKLSNADVAKVDKNSNVNPEAYQLYLKGLFQLNQRTGESIKQSAEFFRQAIEKDPKFALAYVGLARSYGSFPWSSIAKPKDSYPQVKVATLRALELDDSLTEAHLAYGGYLSDFEWDFAASEKELRRAIELDPNNPSALEALSFTLMSDRRRFDEAISLAKRAIELDPLTNRRTLTTVLTYAGRYDEAISEVKTAIQFDPNYAEYYYILGLAYYGKGSYAEAAAAFQKCLEKDDDPVTRAFSALSFSKTGNREEAVKQLDWLKQESSKRYISSFALAITYLALGDKEKTYEWLQRDIDERSGWPLSFSSSPTLFELRDEPRFKAMLKQVGLPE